MLGYSWVRLCIGLFAAGSFLVRAFMHHSLPDLFGGMTILVMIVNEFADRRRKACVECSSERAAAAAWWRATSGAVMCLSGASSVLQATGGKVLLSALFGIICVLEA